MKISWKHLGEFIDLGYVNINTTAIKLTLAGFEVDSIEYVSTIEDNILDISITANRQDIAGWAQMAVEVSAIIERPLKILEKPDNIEPLYLYSTKGPLSGVCVHHIENISLVRNKLNHTQQLKILGLSSTKSILDTIKFINLKWGQKIKVYRFTQKKNQIKNLNIKPWLTEDFKARRTSKVYIGNQALLEITEENIAENISIASIILVNYNEKKVSSQDYCFHAYSEILRSIGRKEKNEKKDLIYYHQYKQREKWIRFTSREINKMLGPKSIDGSKYLLSARKISRITNSLNLYTKIVDDQIIVKIPAIREDEIKEKADIAEEVARIYGFHNFHDRLPKFQSVHRKSEKYIVKQRIRRALRSIGMHEIINYSFESKKNTDYAAKIVNPLNQEDENLRVNLIKGVINTKIYNVSQGNESFEAFEIGHVFRLNVLNQSYGESVRLSCLLGNENFNYSSWQIDKTRLTWLQAKGHAEELFEKINAHILWSASVKNNHFIESVKEYTHPKKRIYITHQNQAIGILSQIDCKKNNINSKNYFIEVHLAGLLNSIQSKNHLRYIYNHYSMYPKVIRDFSTTVSIAIATESIISCIKHEQENKIIESVSIVSEYYNNRDKKTICFRVIYRSKLKTLTSKEIKILDDKLKLRLNQCLRARHKPGSVLNNCY